MEFKEIPLDKIAVDEEQSRQQFDVEELENLTASIEELGQLQPVIVLPLSSLEEYLLIAGERRYRAMQQAEGVDSIAALVADEDLPPEKIREINLVENLQRRDLNELERAQGISLYMEEHGLNKKQASKHLGIPRTTLTEWLQILEIDDKYQQAVLDEDCALSLSHVNLALSLSSRSGNPVLKKELMDAIIKFNLSRHEVKKITRLYQRHLHLEMEEAVGAVLIDRERQKAAADLNDLLEEEKRQKPVKSLLNHFSRTADKLEEFMEDIGHLEPDEEKALLDEFLYIYQMLKLMIPELEDKSLEEITEEYRSIHEGQMNILK